jgi:hypothetical protein
MPRRLPSGAVRMGAAAIGARVPHLLQRYGVGPGTAAALLLAVGDNPIT